jgi:hypothetical protein
MVIKINDEIDYYRNSFSSTLKPKKSYLTPEDYDDSDYVYLPKSDPHDDYSIFDHDDGYMVCCGVRVGQMGTDCYCQTPIFVSDLLEFDKQVKDHAQIYQDTSECHTCAFYYEPKCPAYREVLTEYTRNRAAFNLSNYIKSISGCSNYTYYRDVFVSVRSE